MSPPVMSYCRTY